MVGWLVDGWLAGRWFGGSHQSGCVNTFAHKLPRALYRHREEAIWANSAIHEARLGEGEGGEGKQGYANTYGVPKNVFFGLFDL